MMKRKPTTISVTESEILVSFSDKSSISTPLELFPRLAQATPEQRAKWRWIGDHEGVHWPEVDEDIAIRTLIRESYQTQDSFVKVPTLIADLFRISQHLERLFHDRHFTLDGHLVGSIGEVVARYVYDLVLQDCSTPQVDALTRNGETVQVKLTGPTGKSYGIRWSNSRPQTPPELLICLKLTEAGFKEVYAGRFPLKLLQEKKDTSNGQISLSVNKLLSMNVHDIPQKKSLNEFNRLFNRELDEAA